MRIKLYALIIFSISYANQIINLPLDPISHNNYYLNSVYPRYQPDLFGKEHIVDGSLGSPLSVYILENLYSEIDDSIRTTSSLLYHQGDVGYRKFNLDIKTKVDSLGILKLLGSALSYPGQTAQYADGNILQNYLLHFSKKYSSSLLAIYTGYHFENKDLKYINSNSGEAYFSGFNYSILKPRYELDLNYAFQMGSANHPELSKYYITWGILNSKYHISNNFFTYTSSNYKSFYNDDTKYYFNKLKFGFSFSNSFVQMDIGADYPLSDLTKSGILNSFSILPDIIFKTKFDHFNIHIGTANNFFNYFKTVQFNIDDKKWGFSGFNYSFFNISYNLKNIYLELEPRVILTGDVGDDYSFGLNAKSQLNYNILNTNTTIIPFILSLNKTNISLSLDYNYYMSSFLISTIPLRSHAVSSLKIIESKGDKRYNKFLGVEYTGIQFNSYFLVDLDQINIFTPTDRYWYWYDNRLKNYLDFYIGVEFEKFIFSWHFTNLLSEDYIINYDGNIKNLNMQYISVKWKFDD